MYQDDSFATGYAVGRDSTNGYYNNGGLFGNSGWEGIIGLIVVAGLFGGNWGGGIFGNRGGSPATQADLASGFNNQAVLANLNDIILGQSQMQNFINQGFSGLNQTVTTVGSNLSNAICTLGYNQASLVNGLSRELAQCCCDTRSAIADVKYANERNTYSIIEATNANTRAILDFLTNEKIEGLRAENTALKGRISDDYQADRIISKLSPCPSPAYIVPNPNCCYNYGVTNFGGCGASVV
ncbi:MAG: hypothetical protein IJ371_02900 [Clostridia bacterium]|nr:hypothetical protein [Clostridia bacterium]